MHRLASKRVTVGLVEVQPIVAWPLYRSAVGLAAAFFAAEDPAAEFDALQSMYAFFLMEAQPVWALEDHRGPIPATLAGMLRLPLPMAVEMFTGWTDLFTAVAPTTAVDELIPPGKLRDDLNRRLKAVA